MHELFLTATVANDDVQMAIAILQGYCGHSPVSLLRRRLIYEGPDPRGLSGIASIVPAELLRLHHSKPNPWKDLNEQLTRESFLLTLIFDISKDRLAQPEVTEDQEEEGPGKSIEEQPILDCDKLPGTLRWADLPDPAGGRQVNGRSLITFDNERGLCKLMTTMYHRFRQEILQECYRFVHKDVVIELSRYLQLHPNEKEPPTPISGRLPAVESLTPFDPRNKWVLTVSVVVFNGNDPEQLQKGIDELLEVKNDFAGCFELRTLDRHNLDTRMKN